VKELSNQTFYVGPWQIEPTINQISCDQNVLQLPPKVMAALVLFAESEDKTINK